MPEQVKMLLDDAIRRQSALADRVEFEPDEDDDMEKDNTAAQGEICESKERHVLMTTWTNRKILTTFSRLPL